MQLSLYLEPQKKSVPLMMSELNWEEMTSVTGKIYDIMCRGKTV